MSTVEVTVELEEKVERLCRLLAGQGLAGLLLGAQANLAWITGGRLEPIDSTREAGVATVLIGADGRRWVLADSIEMPRLLAEELAGLDFALEELAWTEAMTGLATLAGRARALLGGGGALASDLPLPGARLLGTEVARARCRLTAAELERFRALGRDAGEALGEVCRRLEPGLSEREIARRTADALLARGAAAVVLLVGADERIGRFRHPLPTAARFRERVMVVACARRAGLTVALTRIVAAGPVPGEIAHRTRAAAGVFGRLLAATRPEATGRELFAVAARAYEDLGFPGEERLHHQGGACGYLSRDWVAHPECAERVDPPQGFAWNPSITGTKVEETAIVQEDRLELITATPGWPSLEVEAGGSSVYAPAIAALEDL